MTEVWRSDLENWLEPFLAALRHKARMRVCPAYIAGLIGPGDRKSVQPMAARSGEFGYDQLHHFVADGVWDRAPLEAVLLKEAGRVEATCQLKLHSFGTGAPARDKLQLD